jgi:hypothetical protein
VAIVMVRRGLDRPGAVKLLKRHGGNLRAIEKNFRHRGKKKGIGNRSYLALLTSFARK